MASEAGMVVIGGGLAGARGALELRKLGYEGSIKLIGAEKHLPYNRPPMSKSFLRGEEGFVDTLVAPEERYQKRQVELMLGRTAEKIDAEGHRVILDGGEELSYEKLLVATGGRKRRLSFAGSELGGIFDLRTVDDSEKIKEEAASHRRAVIIGLGFIGCEVAASLRMLGLEVVALEPAETPLARVLGKEVGDGIANLHRQNGNTLRLGEGVERLEGKERVERVITAKGDGIECDFVVVGIGVEPNVDLLKEAGAKTSDGVDVDAACRTSLPDVYAAGDIANHDHPVFGRIRVEHWNNADQMGRFVAASMLGQKDKFDYIHSFWSDQFDKTLEYIGFAKKWDRVEVEGSIENFDFLARYYEGDRILAAAAMGRGGDPEMDDGELKQIADQMRSQARA